MSYGDLYLPPKRANRDPNTGRFVKGATPHNKGKRWSDYMDEKGVKKCAVGWANLDKYRKQYDGVTHFGRPQRKIVAVTDEGKFIVFASAQKAAEWCGGKKGCVRSCCYHNLSRKRLHTSHGVPTDKVNTDHKYKGVRFYFENDNVWTKKIDKYYYG